MKRFVVMNGTSPRIPSPPRVFAFRVLLWSIICLQAFDRTIYGLKEAANILNSVVFTSQKK